MKTILITGGSGFVGGHLLKTAPDGHKVASTYKDHPIVMPGIICLHLDLENPDGMERAVRRVHPDVIIHAAAWADLETCQREPERARRINTESARILAEHAASYGARMVFVSTDMVFNGSKGDYKEDDPVEPVNVYGETKVEAEKAVLEICPDSAVARAALIYGPPATGSNSFSERILRRISAGEKMPLFYDQFRTPILVQDLAAALWELTFSDFRGRIHVAGPDRTDRYSFGKALAEEKGYSLDLLEKVSMHDRPTEAPRPVDASLNTGLARIQLKTKISGVREGVKRA